MIEFRILGPIVVLRSDEPITPRQAMLRALLAVLISQGGRPISAERLADALWEGEPPASARKTLQIYVHRLRAELGDARRIQHGPGGYALTTAPTELDAALFADLVRQARTAASAGEPGPASELFHQALALWRGEPYADVGAGQPVLEDARRLAEEHLRVQEECAGTDLVLGRHAELAGTLGTLVVAHPYRESLRGLHMIALVRSGRQGEALAAYRQAREILADQLGIEPGQELQELHAAILRGEEVGPARQQPTAAVPSAPAPAQLPAGSPAFTGRAAELRRLDTLLDANLDTGSPVSMVISAISGTAGIGKTTLAVHWAHRIAERFPGGQLYVNLRGFDPGCAMLSPDDALRGFLSAMDVPADRIPTELHERSALFRSTLAGRRMLILLDNARDADQVRPLMPGSPGCLVLVTSRNRLSGLVAAEGAMPLALDLMTDDEARQLLSSRLGADRVGAEPLAADLLIALCARLPLALAVAAARAAAEPDLRLAELVADLRAARQSLDAFAGDDAATDVRAVFSWSYRTLSPAAARMFRLLGLHAGPEIGVPAAASLAGLPVPQAQSLLVELERAHLTTQQTPGRWACHDLLRAYATELVGEVETDDERSTAIQRVLDHYLHSAFLGTRRIYPHRHPIELTAPQAEIVVAAPADREEAMAWFSAEHATLLAITRSAVETGFHRHAWQLGWSINMFLDWRGLWHDQAALHEIGLDAATRSGDLLGQAYANQGLASCNVWLRNYGVADGHYRRALELFREIDDEIALAHLHLNVAIFREQEENNADALHHGEEALKIFDAIGHLSGQAKALNIVGWFQSVLGDYRTSLVTCERSLALHRELGDRYGEAVTGDSVGYAQHHLGEHAAAAASYRAALSICAELGDRPIEALILTHLGDTLHAQGDLPGAHAAWSEALVTFEELNHGTTDEVRDKLAALDKDLVVD